MSQFELKFQDSPDFLHCYIQTIPSAITYLLHHLFRSRQLILICADQCPTFLKTEIIHKSLYTPQVYLPNEMLFIQVDQCPTFLKMEITHKSFFFVCE